MLISFITDRSCIIKDWKCVLNNNTNNDSNGTFCIDKLICRNRNSPLLVNPANSLNCNTYKLNQNLINRYI